MIQPENVAGKLKSITVGGWDALGMQEVFICVKVPIFGKSTGRLVRWENNFVPVTSIVMNKSGQVIIDTTDSDLPDNTFEVI